MIEKPLFQENGKKCLRKKKWLTQSKKCIYKSNCTGLCSTNFLFTQFVLFWSALLFVSICFISGLFIYFFVFNLGSGKRIEFLRPSKPLNAVCFPSYHVSILHYSSFYTVVKYIQKFTLGSCNECCTVLKKKLQAKWLYVICHSLVFLFDLCMFMVFSHFSVITNS